MSINEATDESAADAAAPPDDAAGEKAGGKSGEKSGGKPGGNPSGKPGGKSGGKSGGSSGGNSGGKTGARSARRRSRELAMQGLYQWLVSGEGGGGIQAHIESSPGFDRADRGHFETLLHGVIRESEEINKLILPFLDREVAHLSPVERATMMIGCFELLRHQEIPYRVVINEAVELAKSFGGTDGYKYVNGVLDKLAGTIRPAEARGR
jgi:N utilization substance protein B